VRTFQLFNPEAVPVDATLDNTDLLPAATLTWEIRKNMQVRGGYAKTLSLPDFRELSPASYNEVIGGREIYGNPALKRATIQNFDLRWEWYPAKGETVSIGLFHKKFIDPIESVSIPGATPSQSYANAKGATNQGIELDFRKKLGFVSRALSDIYIAANWAMIQSEVELDRATATNQTRLKRPLQGQSPYVLNVQAGYENPDWGTAASLLYNRIGRRISDVGTQNVPDIYEEPTDLLDFVFDQSVGDGFKMKAKAANLLDPEFKATQGGEVTDLTRKGREYSLGLSWSF
jgi:TonB-dependent receptor